MTSFSRLVAGIAAAATVQLGVLRVVSAQSNDPNDNSWCFDSRFDNLNATASYSVPGFKPPGDSSKSTWTFSTGAVTYDGNTTQRLWINTSPAIQVDSDNLPYQGCIIALLSLVAKPGEKNNGDCTSSLGKECVAALLEQTNEKTKVFPLLNTQEAYRNRSEATGVSPSSFQCGFLSSVLPTECGISMTDIDEVRKWEDFICDIVFYKSSHSF